MPSTRLAVAFEYPLATLPVSERGYALEGVATKEEASGAGNDVWRNGCSVSRRLLGCEDDALVEIDGLFFGRLSCDEGGGGDAMSSDRSRLC